MTKAIENNIVDLNGENNVMLYFYDDVFNNQNEYAENQINVVTKSYDPEHTTVPEYMKNGMRHIRYLIIIMVGKEIIYIMD